MSSEAEQRRLDVEEVALAPTTRDGHRLCLLVNANCPEDVSAGLRAGASGLGLMRTELAFLDRPVWPTQRDHEAALLAVVDALGPDRTATIRLLDLGGDKRSRFLPCEQLRGISLLLSMPEALDAQ